MGRGTDLTLTGETGRAAAAGSGLPVDRDPQRIAAMFDSIVSRYDLMNRLMTAGLDGRWRACAAREAALAPRERALDVCCGTGDLAFTLQDAWPGIDVVGVDFAEAMLERARGKAEPRRCRGIAPPHFVRGDVLDLPFPDGEFGAVTVGWGVRNVRDVPRAFSEMRRVTRPGGRVVCLESTRPSGPAGNLFHSLWMGRVVPLLGRIVAGDAAAYSYLPVSVETFPRAGELAAVMAGAGLTGVRYRCFGFGAIALHVGEVPAASSATA